MNESMLQPIETPADLASYMLRHMSIYGTATIPQMLLDRFNGFQTGLGTFIGTQSGSGYNLQFRLTGQYSDGYSGYNQQGTVQVDSFGLRLTDDSGQKLWWVDFKSDGDLQHREMHYHEAGWDRGMRVYSSQDSASFWSNISKWQSQAFTGFLEEYKGQEIRLFDLD